MPRSPGVKPTARAPTGAGLRSPGGCWPAGTSQAGPGLPGLWGSRGASPEPSGSPCSPRRPGGRAGPLLSKPCRRRQRPGPADRRGGRRDPSWEPVAAEDVELGPCSPTVTETGRAGVQTQTLFPRSLKEPPAPLSSPEGPGAQRRRENCPKRGSGRAGLKRRASFQQPGSL